MHITHKTPGLFKTLLMTIWLVLAWLCCTVASAATSVSVVVTASATVAPADVTLSVVVTATPNPVTVARVEYVNGNSRMGVATTAPFSLNLPSLEPGKYVIKAYVWLADGQNTMLVSTPVTLSITGGTAASAAVYYIHTDQLNTPRVITDQNQAVVWKWESDGFGSAPPNEQPGAAAKFEFNPRFAGQYFDRESALHYNYFRDYDPSTGRYIQSDPIGLLGGLNTYGYVGGNPISWNDPTGLVAPALFLLGEVAVGTEAVSGLISTIAGVALITHGLTDGDDPASAKNVSPVNPGKDSSGKCNPCPPDQTWSHPGNAHGSTGGVHFHGLVWNQNKKTCQCFPNRVSGPSLECMR